MSETEGYQRSRRKLTLYYQRVDINSPRGKVNDKDFHTIDVPEKSHDGFGLYSTDSTILTAYFYAEKNPIEGWTLRYIKSTRYGGVYSVPQIRAAIILQKARDSSNTGP